MSFGALLGCKAKSSSRVSSDPSPCSAGPTSGASVQPKRHPGRFCWMAKIEERRTTSNLYTPFFPRNSQNYQEKYPKGTRFSCKPWGFQHEGLSLRHNQTQSYTITCADHMISQKDTFSSCLFSILSTFMFPFSAQTGDFNGEFILINRMVDLQNPREHRHPPRERSPVHMTWRNSPPWRLIVGPLFS